MIRFAEYALQAPEVGSPQTCDWGPAIHHGLIGEIKRGALETHRDPTLPWPWENKDGWNRQHRRNRSRTVLTLNPSVPHPMFPPFVISLKPAKPFLYRTGLRNPRVGNPTLNR